VLFFRGGGGWRGVRGGGGGGGGGERGGGGGGVSRAPVTNSDCALAHYVRDVAQMSLCYRCNIKLMSE
jgi:hypothetical protein